MTLTVEQIGKYLGQAFEDPMGRPSGKLVGLTADVKDEVQAVQVALSNGEVTEYPINSVRVTNGRPIILEAWRRGRGSEKGTRHHQEKKASARPAPKRRRHRPDRVQPTTEQLRGHKQRDHRKTRKSSRDPKRTGSKA